MTKTPLDSIRLMLVSRPFVAIAGALIAGIVAQKYAEFRLNTILLALALCFPFLFWARARQLAGGLIIFVLGALLYVERYRINSNDDLRLLFAGKPELATVRGRLVETPSVREVQAGRGEVSYSYTLIDVAEVQRNKQEWRAAEGRIATRLRGELPDEFFRGRTVEVTGVLSFPARAEAPGLFDYRAYLHNTRVFFQLKSDSTNDWRLLSFEPMPLTEKFRRWAAVQLQRGIPAEDEASETIAAMTLGLRNSMNGEMTDVFMRTGTLHIVAISGLHVACIAYFLSKILLRLIGIPRALTAAAILAVIWFYTTATGLQSSAVRSAAMATVFMLSWILKRPPELTNTVAASAALILLIQPEQLFQASFQLSFSVVLVIALTVNLFEQHYPNAKVTFRNKAFRIDPLLPEGAIPSWKKRLIPWVGLATGNFVISAVSLIGSAPLSVCYFNTFSPVSLIANMVAVPLSSISLTLTVISILIPPIAPFTNYFAWLAMHATIRSVEFFGSFSWGYFYMVKPNALFLFAYAVGVAVLFIPRLRSGLRKFASAGLVALLSIFWLGSVYAARPLAEITVLPCAGTPTLVEEPRWKELLIDCSSARDADYMLKRFLRSRGRGSIDGLVITHGDAQVVGGFDAIWEEFSPEKVFTSEVRMRSPGYRNAIDALRITEGRWERIAAGSRIAGWMVLHPGRGERGFPRADDNAVVLRRSIGDWTFLHLSDLGEAGQKKLLESGQPLDSDIVIAGMPEQGEPLNDELLKAIQPKVIILGTAEYPYTALGKPELRARLQASGAAIFYVNEQDAVTVKIRMKECVIESMKGKRMVLANSGLKEE